MLGCPPPPGADPPRADPSPSRPPQSRHPPRTRPPRDQTPPEADSSIRSTSGRYASYWNAFLLLLLLQVNYKHLIKYIYMTKSCFKFYLNLNIKFFSSCRENGTSLLRCLEGSYLSLAKKNTVKRYRKRGLTWMVSEAKPSG